MKIYGRLMPAILACMVVGSAPAAEAASETVLYSFKNKNTDPEAALIYAGGLFYGTTVQGGRENCGAVNCGSVFAITPKGKEAVLHSFADDNADGVYPASSLVKVQGSLFGTTAAGGAAGRGTIFSIDPGTGAEAILHSFQYDGTDGIEPDSALLKVGGTLFGATQGGGTDDFGTVFAIDPSTGEESVVHSFQENGSDGIIPESGLIKVGGKLYGTTLKGGANTSSCGGYACGTVYWIDPATGREKVLYSFCNQPQCTDGAFPVDSLIDVGGLLYGVSMQGGQEGCQFDAGCGTVFSIDPHTGRQTVLHTFQDNGSDGKEPFAGLVELGGKLYGTTSGGGAGESGTVYSIDVATGAEKIVYAFKNNGADGQIPSAALIAVGGDLYGTTLEGGSFGQGTVFRIKL
jgi:uncharacterized repeat protein (TIGR03803 family)